MGSPDFAVYSLRALVENFDVVGVVTQPDKPAGRGKKMHAPLVKVAAEELRVPVYQPERLRTDEQVAPIAAWQPDVIVVAAYGQILRKNLLEMPDHGCINVHASLLPRWRGAAPINAAILHGDEETGVTIMQMDVGLDTGDMLRKRSMKIGEDESAGALFLRLAEMGAELIVDMLPDYMAGEITAEPQDDSISTYAPMLNKRDGELDAEKSAEELERQVRAYSPWPGSYLMWDEQMLKVHGARVVSGDSKTPGTRIVFEGLPTIHTQNGILVLEEVQPAGKKRMHGTAFLNGARGWETQA